MNGNDLRIGVELLGGGCVAYAVFMFLRYLTKATGRGIASVMLTPERRLLHWLQDRATARTLGVDVDVIRFRRKIDFPDQRA